MIGIESAREETTPHHRSGHGSGRNGRAHSSEGSRSRARNDMNDSAVPKERESKPGSQRHERGHDLTPPPQDGEHGKSPTKRDYVICRLYLSQTQSVGPTKTLDGSPPQRGQHVYASRNRTNQHGSRLAPYRTKLRSQGQRTTHVATEIRGSNESSHGVEVGAERAARGTWRP